LLLIAGCLLLALPSEALAKEGYLSKTSVTQTSSHLSKRGTGFFKTGSHNFLIKDDFAVKLLHPEKNKVFYGNIKKNYPVV
jgi:hypothetical protein